LNTLGFSDLRFYWGIGLILRLGEEFANDHKAADLAKLWKNMGVPFNDYTRWRNLWYQGAGSQLIRSRNMSNQGQCKTISNDCSDHNELLSFSEKLKVKSNLKLV